MLKMYGVHPIVARKMRNYAVKQALDELGNDRDPKQIEYIAKRHMLSYTELKQAIKYRERIEEAHKDSKDVS